VPQLVALDLPQGPQLAVALAGVWEAGDAACVLDPRLPDEVRLRHLEVLAPTAILDATGLRAHPGGREVEAGDALVVMTSGSSADPKAAVLTHEAVAASAHAANLALGIDPARHRWVACLPCAHIGGLSVITRALLSSTPLVVLPRPDPGALEDMAREGATHVSLVATALGRIEPSWFDCILLGGAAPPAGLPSNVVTTYGMTETGSGIVYDGTALAGVELAVRHADAEGLGEVLVRAPQLARTYRDRPLPLVEGPDGTATWFPTGDLGSLDDRGALTVRGRSSEVIVTGAEKVFPTDVEQVLVGLAGIAEVAVWKRPDAEWGERVVAFVVPEGEPPELEDLRAAVREHLAPWAAPREVVLVESLPRTDSGKLARRRLA
jgi:o-succinylbenzoate---CoA ligase